MTVEELEILAQNAASAGNATLLNRFLDAAIEDNVLFVCRGGSGWMITTPMGQYDTGDFEYIRASVASVIVNEARAAEYEASRAA